jgi:TetR/AcrR family transcriptional repressor of mexJK operon
VAKATLYANFSDKDDLIESVIRRESDRTVTDEDFEKGRSGPAEDALTEYGKRYLHFINQRETLGWDRLISLAAARNPELPRRLFSAGPGRGQMMLTAMIEAAIKRGELKKVDASAAADDLAGLWIGFTHLEIKLGARPPLSPAEIDARVLRGVQLFMLIYGTTNAN